MCVNARETADNQTTTRSWMASPVIDSGCACDCIFALLHTHYCAVWTISAELCIHCFAAGLLAFMQPPSPEPNRIPDQRNLKRAGRSLDRALIVHIVTGTKDPQEDDKQENLNKTSNS